MIILPSVSQQVDYEAELVVVIGRSGRHIPRERAFEHVGGYAVGHDVSARDWQLNKPGKQWMAGKTFDTFAPVGPVLVTPDEVPDPHKLGIRLRLNGQTMQESSTSQLIFGVDELIAYVSQVFTLEPGDLIFTGTPPGVGMARKPPGLAQAGRQSRSRDRSPGNVAKFRRRRDNHQLTCRNRESAFLREVGLKIKFTMSSQPGLKDATMSIASEKPQLSGYGQPTWDVARLFPAQGCWTEEDYLELKPNRWVEFSHGFVEFLATPTLSHQLAALYLYRTLETFVSTRELGTALAGPYRVRLWEGKYREPDVLFVGGKHASRLTENYCKGADLVMEVVSDGEESHRLDRETKRDEYAKARIPEYWIVDPEQARITVLFLDGRSYRVLG